MAQRPLYILLLACTALLAGCPLPPHPGTPVSYLKKTEPLTDTTYYLYVPSYYSADRDWPLVVTLHGTYGWDGAWAQVMEWKHVAETHGFLVAAPRLGSVQGVLPVTSLLRSQWMKDLADDDRAILAVVDDVRAKYRVDGGDAKTGRRPAVLLTGFSAGGYPLYYTGLRHPEKFNMLIARACNSHLSLMEPVKVTEALRKTPIMIFWGKDDLKAIDDQSWQAFGWLRTHRCFETKAKKLQGGHLRRPETAYQFWMPYLPVGMRQ